MADYNSFLEYMGENIITIKQNQKRNYFEVKSSYILMAASYLFREMGCRLSTATAQESYRGIEVMYHFSLDKSGEYFCPVVVLKKDENLKSSSIAPLITGAEWIEREMSEMFGITFEGLPDPSPLLTGNHPENLNTPWIHRRPNEN
jgi:NADH-quinone oxidoreductase subunit C